MARDVVNPFQTLALQVPRAEWDNVRRFTSTFREEEQGEPNLDKTPFRRYVDLWWAGLCIGVQEGRRTTAGEWHRFIDGVILTSDPWRITQLELLAVALEGPEIVKDPAKIITMANEYAATGIKILVEVMVGQMEPVWAVTNFLKERIAKSPVEGAES
jgi:hypothetical protein